MMKKTLIKTEYYILEGESRSELWDQVTEELEIGWELQGGVCTYNVGRFEQVRYTQAIIKKTYSTGIFKSFISWISNFLSKNHGQG